MKDALVTRDNTEYEKFLVYPGQLTGRGSGSLDGIPYGSGSSGRGSYGGGGYRSSATDAGGGRHRHSGPVALPSEKTKKERKKEIVGTIEARKKFRTKSKHKEILHYSIYLIEIRSGNGLTVSTGIVFLAGSLVATRKVL